MTYACRIEGGKFIPTFASENLRHYWGYEPSEYIGDTEWWAEHIHPEDLERVLASFPSCLFQNRKFEHQYRFRHKDGIYRWVNDKLTIICDVQGKPVEIVGSWIDITERKKAEEELNERTFFLNESQKVARLGTYVFCTQTGEWTSSEILDDIFGIDADYKKDVDGWQEIIYPDDRQPMLDYLQINVLSNKETFNREYRIIRVRDGEERWVHGLGKLELGPDGEVVRMIGTIQDITDRKRAEAALQESEEKWRSLTEYSPDHIMLLDTDLTIQFINHTVPDLTKEQVIGKVILDFMPSDCPQMAIECFERVMQSGKADRFKTTYFTSEGEMQYFDARVSPLTDKDGNVTSFVCTANNVTELELKERALRESEEKLRKYSENLEAIVEEKSKQVIQMEKLSSLGELMGGIAHQINNPLVGVVNFSQLVLKNMDKDYPLREDVETIRKAGIECRDIIKETFGIFKAIQF